MAIEAVAALAVKEIGTQVARDVSMQSACEIAQKMISEAGAQSVGHELQTAMMERQSMQDGFRIGEMPEMNGEEHEVLKHKEVESADVLREKLGVGERQSELKINSEMAEQNPEAETPDRTESEKQGIHEASESVDSREISEGNENPIEYEVHTRNESLEGDCHPITGIPFEKKTVEDAEGNKVTGVFPEFESKYDAQLPDELHQASDKDQFEECNKQLKDALENDPEMAKQFSKEQLEQIKNGDTPDGYTWHHNEEKGKMQLVDSEIHAQTGHTGGKVIWGGGNEFR